MLHFDSNWVSVTLQFLHLLSCLTIWAQQKGQILRMSPLTCALTANYNGHFYYAYGYSNHFPANSLIQTPTSATDSIRSRHFKIINHASIIFQIIDSYNWTFFTATIKTLGLHIWYYLAAFKSL